MSELEEWSEVGDDELVVPISAIEHYSYCPRQCGLIHVEQTWEENLYTLRGRAAHERVHAEGDAPLPGGRGRAVRGLRLWSTRLGLTGKADLVELRPEGPYPVEFKVGVPQGEHASLQLAAQALCLEEMLGAPVPRGALFAHATHRRIEVEIDAALRGRVEAVVGAIRGLLRAQRLPEAPNDARCRRCSLRDSCLPEVMAARARLRGFQGALFRIEG